MLAATFSLDGVEDTAEAHEAAWDGWVETLRFLGVEPQGEPVSWTETTVTYGLQWIVPAVDFLAYEKVKTA